MKTFLGKKLFALYLFASILAFSACKDKDEPETEETASADTQKVTQFALDVLNDVYLWNTEIPSVDITKIQDPIAMVDSIRYSADRWTMLTDDVNGLNEEFSGEGTSFGYSLTFGKFTGTSNYFALVQFVYPGTPAALAGMKRGDIIVQIDGESITTSNYTKLYYNSTISLAMGTYSGSSIGLSGQTISLTASTMYQEPVNTYKVIKKGDHKIAYLAYTDYTLKSLDKLKEVFQSFKDAGATDVVLDLRYNGGGYSIAGQFLSSILVPASALDNKSIYLKQTWNTTYTTYWASKNYDLNDYFTTSYTYTDDNDASVTTSIDGVNMNLSTLYVLVSGGTASASEATITGLSPYMNLIMIGEQTYGKYCGGIVFEPSDFYTNPASALDNWGIYTMVYRFADKNGKTDCMPDGFTPTYTVEDNLFDGYSLGDENEALLAKAISLITGTTTTSSSIKTIRPDFKMLKGAKSRKSMLEGKMISLPSQYNFTPKY